MQLDFKTYTSKSLTLFKVKHIEKIFRPNQMPQVVTPPVNNRNLIPLPVLQVGASTAPFTSFRVGKQPLVEDNLMPSRRASHEHQQTTHLKNKNKCQPTTSQPTGPTKADQLETLQLRSDEVVMFKALESIDKRTQEFLTNPDAVPLSLDPAIEAKFSEKQ